MYVDEQSINVDKQYFYECEQKIRITNAKKIYATAYLQYVYF